MLKYAKLNVTLMKAQREISAVGYWSNHYEMFNHMLSVDGIYYLTPTDSLQHVFYTGAESLICEQPVFCPETDQQMNLVTIETQDADGLWSIVSNQIIDEKL